MSTKFQLYVANRLTDYEIPFDNVMLGRGGAPPPPIADLALACRRALDGMDTSAMRPLGADSRVVIISDDYTRPTPVSLIAPSVLQYLRSRGVRKENISFLIGAGFHRAMTGDELAAKLGRDICREYPVYHHNAQDRSMLTYLGTTSGGLPVSVNSLAANADFLLGIGIVEIHPWAGFAGGPKILCPGVVGKATINQTHAIPVLEYENVRIGRTSGNPFWEAICEAARMARLDMAVNVVMDRSERVCALCAGEPVAAQKSCIETFMQFNSVSFPEAADIVITTADPKFQYWGQSSIAGFNADAVVREGGLRIVLAACPEGFGDSQQEIVFYFDSLKSRWSNLNRYWAEKQGVEQDNSRNACAIHRHLLLQRRSNILMVSQGFPSSTPVMASQPLAATMDEAMAIALRRYGRNARVAVYDLGAMVLPSIE